MKEPLLDFLQKNINGLICTARNVRICSVENSRKAVLLGADNLLFYHGAFGGFVGTVRELAVVLTHAVYDHRHIEIRMLS